MCLPSGSVTFVVISLTPAIKIFSTCAGVRLSLMRYLPVLTLVVSPSHIAYIRNHVGRSITPLSASITAICGKLIPVLTSISTSLPAPACVASGYANARCTKNPATPTTSTTDPITTASATLNDRLDICRLGPLYPASIEPGLQDERRGLLIDHGAPLRAGHVGVDQDALRFGRGETFILFVKFHGRRDARAQRCR